LTVTEVFADCNGTNFYPQVDYFKSLIEAKKALQDSKRQKVNEYYEDELDPESPKVNHDIIEKVESEDYDSLIFSVKVYDNTFDEGGNSNMRPYSFVITEIDLVTARSTVVESSKELWEKVLGF